MMMSNINVNDLDLNTRKIMDKMQQQSEGFNDHVIEAVVYKDLLPDKLNTWCESIASWLSRGNNHMLASSHNNIDNKNLDVVFNGSPSDVYDAMVYLGVYQRVHSKSDDYVEFDLTVPLAQRLFDTYQSLIDRYTAIMDFGQKYGDSQWTRIVKEIVV